MIQSEALDPRTVKLFILDEVDETLSRGFKDQIYGIKTCPLLLKSVSFLLYIFMLLRKGVLGFFW